MAQDGDTITYTYDNDRDGNNDLEPEQEDISSVDQMTIEYINGAGAGSSIVGSGSGGRVDNVVVDISNRTNLYIWVGGPGTGRYSTTSGAGGSTELWFENTNETNSADEPFIAAAGGGGEGGFEDEVFNPILGPQTIYLGGDGGARGGIGGTGSDGDGDDGSGTPPPLGGDGGDASSSEKTSGEDGEGAVNTTLAEVNDAGSTTTGGGSGPSTNGEVRISYKQTPPPDPPSNLSAEVQ